MGTGRKRKREDEKEKQRDILKNVHDAHTSSVQTTLHATLPIYARGPFYGNYERTPHSGTIPRSQSPETWRCSARAFDHNGALDRRRCNGPLTILASETRASSTAERRSRAARTGSPSIREGIRRQTGLEAWLSTLSRVSQCCEGTPQGGAGLSSRLCVFTTRRLRYLSSFVLQRFRPSAFFAVPRGSK